MSEQTDPNVEQISASTALVVVAGQSAGQTHARFLSDAGFLAQLLACKAGLGGLRRHRREEPGVASNLYAASAGRGSLPAQQRAKTLLIA